MAYQGQIRRAMLFTPGDDFKKVSKSAASGVDSLILDLEDGVAPDRKAAGRETIAQALQSLDFGRTERIVRINELTTKAAEEDLRATLPFLPNGYLVPKVESADQLAALDRRLSAIERELRLADGKIRLLAMIETARGVVFLREIATSCPRLDALIFGSEDYAGSTGAIRTPESMEVFYAKSAMIAHAAAFDLQAIDSIYTDFQDTDGLIADCKRALQLGFTGKTIIHPNQIAPTQAAFTPDDAAVEKASKLIAAFEASIADGKGAFAYEGKMVDMPMIRAAQRILDRARAAGKL